MPSPDDTTPHDQPGGPRRQWHVPAPGAAGTGGPAPVRPAAAQPAPVQPAPVQPPPQQPAVPPPATPAPGGPPAPPVARPARRWRRWVLVALAVLVALVLGFVVWLWSSYNGIDRVDLDGVLDPVSGDSTNFLLVGSDSRENLDPDDPAALRSPITGSRSDAIILLQVGPSGAVMMSIPRDLWVTNPATGREGRINGAYNDGPANLVRAVQQNLDVPVNHYAEVDFSSFAGVIDAVGGVTLDFAHPAFDTESGLKIIVAGPVTLDGENALAYVRSRNYTEIVDGEEVKDPTADLGRQERQRTFLVSALGEVGAERNPISLGRAAAALSSGLTVDSSLGFSGALSLARQLGGATPETVVLPTRPATIGGASVLLLEEQASQPVLDRFR